jgi:hypothetical protein
MLHFSYNMFLVFVIIVIFSLIFSLYIHSFSNCKGPVCFVVYLFIYILFIIDIKCNNATTLSPCITITLVS